MSYEDMSKAAVLEAEAGHLVETVGRLMRERDEARAECERLRGLLEELFATVEGECPMLLDEDSGGDARLALDIEDALAAK